MKIIPIKSARREIDWARAIDPNTKALFFSFDEWYKRYKGDLRGIRSKECVKRYGKDLRDWREDVMGKSRDYGYVDVYAGRVTDLRAYMQANRLDASTDKAWIVAAIMTSSPLTGSFIEVVGRNDDVATIGLTASITRCSADRGKTVACLIGQVTTAEGAVVATYVSWNAVFESEEEALFSLGEELSKAYNISAHDIDIIPEVQVLRIDSDCGTLMGAHKRQAGWLRRSKSESLFSALRRTGTRSA